MNILKLFVASLLAIFIVGCGGGGGGGSSGGDSIPPPAPSPPTPTETTPPPSPTTPTAPTAPDPTPDPVQIVVQNPNIGPASGGDLRPTTLSLLDGLNIPDEALSDLSRMETRSTLLVLEIDATSYHANIVKRVACGASILGCDLEDLPFTLGGYMQDGGYFAWRKKYLEFKLISASWTFETVIAGLVSEDRRSLPVPVVFSIGNEGYPGILSNWDFASTEYTDSIERYLRRMGVENRLLMVAGYEEDDSGRIVRAERSTGCADIPEICIYAPMSVIVWGNADISGSGTSVATPVVAVAMAEVYHLFDLTDMKDVVKLTKVCAVPEPGLDGLGRADFGCITMNDGDGWRLITGSELSGLINPRQMQQMSFPGNTEVRATFALDDSVHRGGEVNLGTSLDGRFVGRAGLRASLVQWPKSESLLFGLSDNGISFGWKKGDFIFAFGGRQTDGNFFGLKNPIYEEGHAIDASLCLPGTFRGDGLNLSNIFCAHASKEYVSGTSLLDKADGLSLGFSLKSDVASFRVGENDAKLGFSYGTYRFEGGDAETAFGRLNIDQSPWNQEVSFGASFTGKSSSLSVGMEVNKTGGEESRFSAGATFKVHF